MSVVQTMYSQVKNEFKINQRVSEEFDYVC